MIKTSIKTKGLPLTDRIERGLKQMRDDLHDDLVDNTPIDTGLARKGWKKTKYGSENRVDYIEALEDGHSKQAPRGIIQPSINKLVRRAKSKNYFK